MTTKRCSGCGATKDVSAFSRNARNKDGLADRCKECVSAYAHDRYARDPEKYKARMRANYQKDPRPWKAASARRRFRMGSVYNGEFTEADWQGLKEAYGNRCAYCGTATDQLEVEHVNPVSRGGGHAIDNIVPACRHCNSAKRDRTPEEAGMKFVVFPSDGYISGSGFPTIGDAEMAQCEVDILSTCPACLGRKSPRFALCAACFEEYGRDIAKWPEWLQFLVRDNDRIKYAEQVQREYEVDVADMSVFESEVG